MPSFWSESKHLILVVLITYQLKSERNIAHHKYKWAVLNVSAYVL